MKGILLSVKSAASLIARRAVSFLIALFGDLRLGTIRVLTCQAGMAGPVTTGNFARALWPGINKWFNEYKDFQEEWVHLFDRDTSTKAYEKDVGVVGTGLAAIKPEGTPITFDSMQAGFEYTYTHNVYATGVILTEEQHEDGQYPELQKRFGKHLRFSLEQTKEIVCANVYNNAFSGSQVGADGANLISNAHPYKVLSGTWSNTPTTSADISEAALEQAVIDISKFTDERGLRHAFMAESLIIPPDSMFMAARILKSVGQNNSANNAINAIRELGIFPKGVQVNHYLTDTLSWYVRTNVRDGLRYFQRREKRVTIDNESDTKNAKYMADERFAAGCTDPRAFYGSAG